MSSVPERQIRLIAHSEQPYNAEPPLGRLWASYRTPARDLYVRSHGDLPKLDPQAWRLTVDGRTGVTWELSLQDLQSGFREVLVTAKMQ